MDRVELLYWEGCPSHGEALALLETVLKEREVHIEVTVHEVHTHAEAVELAFPGSPTIRVDGRDISPDGADATPALTCRIYRLEDGRVSPVPSRQQMEDALR